MLHLDHKLLSFQYSKVSVQLRRLTHVDLIVTTYSSYQDSPLEERSPTLGPRTGSGP